MGSSCVVGMLDLNTKGIREEVGRIVDSDWQELQMLDRVFFAVLESSSSILALLRL
jgi:hypothetical protein